MAKQKAADTKHLAVRLPIDLHKEVKAFCTQNGIALQDFVFWAIKEHLSNLSKSKGKSWGPPKGL